MERFLRRVSPGRVLQVQSILLGIAELLEATRNVIEAASTVIGDRRWGDAVIRLDFAARVLRGNHRCDEVQDALDLPRRDPEM